VWENSRKDGFGPFKAQYCLPNNIGFLVFVNNFELNPILVNINKLKPYRYVDRTLKGILSSKNPKSLEYIDVDQKKDKSNENSKEEIASKIIDIDQIVTSEKF